MTNINLETTMPYMSLSMITLDTVRPFLALNRDKTGVNRWVQTVVSTLTLSPREIATWAIQAFAEGCYPITPTDEEVVVSRRICHELHMIEHAGDTDPVFVEAFLDSAKSWVQNALDGDELILREDDKEEILTGYILQDLMKELLQKSSALQESLRRHALKHKSFDTWFTDNDDLIAEEAWHYDWPSLVYG